MLRTEGDMNVRVSEYKSKAICVLKSREHSASSRTKFLQDLQKILQIKGVHVFVHKCS